MEDRAYATTAFGAQSAQAQGISDRPYLARIAEAADEADRIANYVENFLARCRGGNEAGANAARPTAVPTGHLGQIDRLTESMARLDKLARELQLIG